MFGALWLGQIAGAINDGVLPVAVSDLDVPTSAVYALDLAFALPLLAFSAGLLLRREDHGAGVAVAAFTFVALMALSILGLFAVQVSGKPGSTRLIQGLLAGSPNNTRL